MKPGSGRLLSLDIFRGLTVAFMIMVNNQWGPSFRALNHSPWDGCTPTDLVFPFFLFIVGVSTWFSYRKLGHRLTRESFLRLLKRGLLIYSVGFLLEMYPFWDFRHGTWLVPDPWAWMSVLGRIGIAFFIGGVLALRLGSFKRILWTVAGILIGYWLLIEILGGATFEGYVGRRIDAFIFGRGDDPGFFNAEGFFSTIPAVATVLLGYAAGKFVGENRENKLMTLGGLGIAGGLSVMAALLFNSVCPINKPVWSSTYVLYSAGLAALTWMLLMWFYDNKGVTFGRTFASAFGTNALFAYVLATLVNTTVRIPALGVIWEGRRVNVFHWLANFLGLPTTPETGALLSSLVLIAIVFAVVYPLYRRRIFIKL